MNRILLNYGNCIMLLNTAFVVFRTIQQLSVFFFLAASCLVIHWSILLTMKKLILILLQTMFYGISKGYRKMRYECQWDNSPSKYQFIKVNYCRSSHTEPWSIYEKEFIFLQAVLKKKMFLAALTVCLVCV